MWKNTDFQPSPRQSTQVFPGFPGCSDCAFGMRFLPGAAFDKNWKCERVKTKLPAPVNTGGRAFIPREKFSPKFWKTLWRGTAGFTAVRRAFFPVGKVNFLFGG